MANEVIVEKKFKVAYYLRQIAKRLYPLVFVVEENTEDAWYVFEMERMPCDVQRELAMEAGISVLDGLDVVQNLRGEMDPAGEYVLRDEVRRISAAKQGMVLIDDEDLERLEVTGRMGDAPLTAMMVPVEELLKKDVDQWWFLERLEDLIQDHPVAFIIPPTERVQTFLEEHARQ